MPLQFQSTLPLRGVTTLLQEYRQTFLFQSTLPLRGVTNMMRFGTSVSVFQSTLPLRGVTTLETTVNNLTNISIHTPLAGSDLKRWRRLGITQAFQSTLPLRGVTGVRDGKITVLSQFQSTLPLRGVTQMSCQLLGQFQISIHTPLAGSDLGLMMSECHG